MRRLSLVILLLSACTPPCEDAPLAAPERAVTFAVEHSDHGSPDREVGYDAGVPAIEALSALALYDADGAIAQDRWLDTRTAWDDARGRFDARSPLPASQTPGGVTFLLQEPASVVTLDPANGAVVRDLALPDGGAPIDFIAASEVGLLARDDGLSTIDLERGVVVDTIDLVALAGAGSKPARMAPLAEETLTRVVVGLERPAGEMGAVLVVELATGVASLVELPGLRGCKEVSALTTPPGTPQVAALCTGDLDLEPSLRTTAGVALLEAESGGPVRATQIRNVPSPTPPSEALVGASEGWIAVLSRGEPDTRPDVLLAMHLERGERVVLREEQHSYRYGPALGEGAFDPVTRELWWPSVSGGIVRFRLEGEGENATFVEAETVATPSCQPFPARRVRHLP